MSKKTIVVAYLVEYEMSDTLNNIQEGDGEINDETQAEMSAFIYDHFVSGMDSVPEPIYYICDEGALIDTSIHAFDVNEAIEMAGWVE